MTPTQPMPTTVILELVETFAIDLAREGVDVEAVVRAAHVLARTLARYCGSARRARAPGRRRTAITPPPKETDMDKNLVIVTGMLASATERTVGQQGRTLTELPPSRGSAGPQRRGGADRHGARDDLE